MNFLKDKFVNSDFGVFISLGTFLGYVLYFVNSRSFNSYYNVPSRFLDFSLQNIVSHAFTVGFFVLLTYATRSLLVDNDLFELIEIKIVMGLLFTVPFAMAGISFYNFFDWSFLTESQEYWITTISFAMGIWIFLYLKDYLQLVSIILIFIFAIAIATKMGEHEAITKEEYIIFEKNNKDKYIVVNNYKDMLIIEPVNLETKVISPSFEFIEVKSDKDNKIKFKVIHTGRLKVE